MGRLVRGCGPRVRPNKGKGWRTCQASGFTRKANDFTEDVRQGDVSPEFADKTPGFGTYHPQDVKNLGSLDDPRIIYEAKPDDLVNASKSDLRISDQEITASIVEGRPPRVGY